MNNSRLTLEAEQVVDTTPMLRQRETELLEILEALGNISSSNYWKVLQDKVFNPNIESLKKRLQDEDDTVEMHRLQGHLRESTRYDFPKMILLKQKELQGIRQQLNAKGN